MSKLRNGNVKRRMQKWKDMQFKHSSVLKCRYCNDDITRLTSTVDHLTPLSRGGTNTEDNFGLSCDDCNNGKADMTEIEYKAFLKEHNYKICKRFVNIYRQQERLMEEARKKDSPYINVENFFKSYKI